MYRPGVSAGISGTAYADSASVSSAVSSVRDQRSRDITPTQTPKKQTDKKRRTPSQASKDGLVSHITFT